MHGIEMTNDEEQFTGPGSDPPAPRNRANPTSLPWGDGGPRDTGGSLLTSTSMPYRKWQSGSR